MPTYLVGDVHGCFNNLNTILNYVHFDPKIDMLYLTGDLISRGPSSLKVLRMIRKLDKHAQTVLGNHEIHLLKTYFGIQCKQSKENFDSILNAPDSDELIHWLLHQPILHIDENKKLLISHAGIHPYWNINQAKQYSQEIENILIGTNPTILFENTTKKNKKKTIIDINIIHNNNNDIQNIRNHLDIFTKMRFIYINGQLNLKYKDTPKYAPSNIYPWFNLIKFIVPEYSIIFGHWANLQDTNTPPGIYGLDSGCCWGRSLTLLCWENKKIISLPCSPPS